MPGSVQVGHLPTDIWFDRSKVEEEEYRYQVFLAQQKGQGSGPKGVAQQIAQAREQIHQTLMNSDAGLSTDGAAKLRKLEDENVDLRKIVDTLVQRMSSLEARLTKLEGGSPAPVEQKPSEPVAQTKEESEDSDDDDDLFASDTEEDLAAQEKLKQERLDAYAEKKAKKPTIIAKSNIILDIKPWDDETDMAELEKCVRSIETDGLLWGISKLDDVAYGIMKLVICCVVEDDKVGTDFLEEKIKAFDKLVQSVDIAAFNKI